MQREEEWVRLATQSNLPKDEPLERAELILSMLKTLSHADARLYIGWVIRLRVSAAEQYVKTQAKRAFLKTNVSEYSPEHRALARLLSYKLNTTQHNNIPFSIYLVRSRFIRWDSTLEFTQCCLLEPQNTSNYLFRYFLELESK